MRRFRRAANTGVVFGAALALLMVYPGTSFGSSSPSLDSAMQQARQRAEAINNVNDVPKVVQNVVPGAVQARDLAIQQFKAAQVAGKAPLDSKPEYTVIWSGKENAGDMSGNDTMRFINQGSISPTGLINVGSKQFIPGLDAMVVVDVRKLNVDGSMNKDYGKVVNFVQVPPPFGVESEPHHMQYEWHAGEPIVAGHLFTDLTTIWDVSSIPEITLKNIVRGEENPIGAFPDAFDFAGKDAIGTYMTAGEPNYGGSPGSVVVFKPDSSKGMVQASETAASQVGAVFRGNPGGVPEPCTPAEARPAMTCGNPHGIQARPDLNRMITTDYADARELGSDPLKTTEQHAFRPTARIWDISNPEAPKLISVGHMPASVKHPPNPAHDNLGIMETGKTFAPSKAVFAESMCGGGIFMLPDITNVQPDSSSQWKQVWDDGMTELQVPNYTNLGSGKGNGAEPGACAGGAWTQISHDNRFLFHTVGGRNPGSTNTFDNGTPKMVYVINVEKLIKHAEQTGNVDCTITSGREIGQGHGDAADCPTLAGVLTVDDNTSGGPHWAGIDNHNLTASGAPTRLLFCDYFVARTGYDGNHRCYMVNVNPETGSLSYDTTFRDENNGSLGIDFNRSDWPGHPGGGFYKPHSMVWVVPEAVAAAG
ncbi:MAG TPA: hypothetical protein VFE55_18435 [Acidimicrobiia bacterium]|nr:hypothetical protein [Acidimicrobiia bacterium]